MSKTEDGRNKAFAELQKILDERGYPEGRDCLNRDLDALLVKFKETNAPMVALEALSRLVFNDVEAVKNMGLQDPDPVGVPWWIVRELAVALMEYKESIGTIDGRRSFLVDKDNAGKFAEAFGIIEPGRGSTSAFSKSKTTAHHRRIAVMVMEVYTGKGMYDSAIDDVATRIGISTATVRVAWDQQQDWLRQRFPEWFRQRGI